MAKRIIKYGTYNKVTCGKCNCEFAFDNTDIEKDGTIICPQCGNAVEVPAKDN